MYANVLGKRVLVSQADVTSLGSAIFAALAAGEFRSTQEAQETLIPASRVVGPEPKVESVYHELFGLYREMYFSFGNSDAMPLGVSGVLPALRRIASAA